MHIPAQNSPHRHGSYRKNGLRRIGAPLGAPWCLPGWRLASWRLAATAARSGRVRTAWLLAVLMCGSIWLTAAGPTTGPLKTRNSNSIGTQQPAGDGFQPIGPLSQLNGNKPRIKFDGQRSYGYLRTLCKLGNRMSGSVGMKQQQRILEKHFVGLGAGVQFQRFKVKHPLNGQRMPMANLVVEWRPKAKERILLCAHYDTRPLPDREINPRVRATGVFLGANDGASGVALLMELGHHVAELPSTYGLDFVLFDGEELVYYDGRQDQGSYFAGSTWFARQYVGHPPQHKYFAGVLFDMVADARLTIYQEEHSASWPATRPLVKEIWNTANRLGIKEFIPRVKYRVNDDHLPLNQIAKIPVCDIIDFEYPDPRNAYWHTTSDAPGRCSADSLGKVGKVIVEWLTTKR